MAKIWNTGSPKKTWIWRTILMREVTILSTISAISTPALLQTISFSQAFSSVNHSVTLFQAVSHLRRLLDGDAFTARSGETFLEFLKELHDILPNFPHRVRDGQTRQGAAASKSTISNLSHGLWDGQTSQRGAVTKSTNSNLNHRLRDGQTRQRGACKKCTTSKFSH